jgi:hypothetical protein
MTFNIIAHDIEDNTGTSKSVRDPIPSSLSVIRNDLYAYSYGVCLSTAPGGSTDYFLGARISYRYSSAGD